MTASKYFLAAFVAWAGVRPDAIKAPRYALGLEYGGTKLRRYRGRSCHGVLSKVRMHTRGDQLQARISTSYPRLSQVQFAGSAMAKAEVRCGASECALWWPMRHDMHDLNLCRLVIAGVAFFCRVMN
jgi:hypothetical protein